MSVPPPPKVEGSGNPKERLQNLAEYVKALSDAVRDKWDELPITLKSSWTLWRSRFWVYHEERTCLFCSSPTPEELRGWESDYNAWRDKLLQAGADPGGRAPHVEPPPPEFPWGTVAGVGLGLLALGAAGYAGKRWLDAKIPARRR